MTLYVIPVPDPTLGADWTYTVPGQYIEHITAVTATLGAGSGTPTTAHDISGNGNDGTYAGTPPATFASGLLFVPSDGASDFTANFPSLTVGAHVNMPAGLLDMSQPFTIEMWVQATPLGQAHGIGGFVGGIGATDPDLRCWMGTANVLQIDQNGGFANQCDGTPLLDGLPHYVVMVYNGSTGVDFFFDNGLQTPLAQLGPYGATNFTNMTLGTWPVGAYTYAIFDEFALYPYDLNTLQIDAHWNAAQASFAAYTAAVVGDTPTVYYHLGGGGTPTPAQVDLAVTDGTHTVLEMPTGFAEPTGTAPWTYNWQPNLNSSTQTPTGSLTTVATPDLILPAGYTIGTRTLDLGAGDQWSDVNIWWSSDVMDALNFRDNYVYPPGVRLVYQKQGA